MCSSLQVGALAVKYRHALGNLGGRRKTEERQNMNEQESAMAYAARVQQNLIERERALAAQAAQFATAQSNTVLNQIFAGFDPAAAPRSGPDFTQTLADKPDILPKELLESARLVESGEAEARIKQAVEAARSVRFQQANPTKMINPSTGVMMSAGTLFQPLRRNMVGTAPPNGY